AVLVSADLEHVAGPLTRIVVADPMRAIAILAGALHDTVDPTPDIDASAHLGRGITLGHDVSIGACVVIGPEVVIGDGCRIGPHVVLERGVILGRAVRLDPRVVVHEGSVLGDRVYCQTGAIVGSPGFGFLSSERGHERVPQVGGCILGDDVEIGAGTCIDRGSLEDTVIGRGTKIDNLVHVGHNVRIGEHCLVLAGVGIAGSTRVGDRVVIAGQAGLTGHIQVGNDARIGAQAGVIASVPDGAAVSGYPARAHRDFLRAQATLYRLTPHLASLERLIRDADA
ncbi:MAG: UDP-3-O-(3-hydroxymyristoyl)glucosamine N-acyltransferase, partial [Gemmatimonadota bacterium]